ncbi:complement C1q-like protein 2 [Garra rufa]|uniref:complement C1q-like protein 2 n=1 Tax=Garra rufa TaxID=137080 RepID=UPI003CCE9D87
MSCIILYPLLLLLFSSATLSEVQQKERGVQANGTQRLNELGSLKNRLQVKEEQLGQLKRQEDKVAFGASLGPVGNVGPFSTDIILVYKDVFVNEGSAYNPTTGIFTAFVKGVYFFTFTGHNRSSKPMGLRLFKNGQQMITVYNHPLGDRYETASNSIALTLEKGDQVYMLLWANTWVFDNVNDHTTFTGYLIFSL